MQGSDVDIVTGRPVGMEPGASAGHKGPDEVSRLKSNAAFLETIESEDGRKMVDIVYRQFLRRAGELISEDPECKAYMVVLKDFGSKRVLAESAANDLAQMAMKNRG